MTMSEPTSIADESFISIGALDQLSEPIGCSSPHNDHEMDTAADVTDSEPPTKQLRHERRHEEYVAYKGC